MSNVLLLLVSWTLRKLIGTASGQSFSGEHMRPCKYLQITIFDTMCTSPLRQTLLPSRVGKIGGFKTLPCSRLQRNQAKSWELGGGARFLVPSIRHCGR